MKSIILLTLCGWVNSQRSAWFYLPPANTYDVGNYLPPIDQSYIPYSTTTSSSAGSTTSGSTAASSTPTPTPTTASTTTTTPTTVSSTTPTPFTTTSSTTAATTTAPSSTTPTVAAAPRGARALLPTLLVESPDNNTPSQAEAGALPSGDRRLLPFFTQINRFNPIGNANDTVLLLNATTEVGVFRGTYSYRAVDGGVYTVEYRAVFNGIPYLRVNPDNITNPNR